MKLSMRRRSRRSRSVLGIGVAMAAFVAVTSCGVETGPSSFERIDDEDIPGVIIATTTTTTVPPSTTSLAPDSSVAPATSAEPPQTERTPIYFLSRGRLKPTLYDVAVPVQPLDIVNDLVSLLEAGPTGPSANVNSSAVPAGLINDGGFQLDLGVLTIDLNSAIYQGIDSRANQTLAIAQIVYTFVQGLNGVGRVRFTMDGEPLPVPDANNINRDEVAVDNYESLLVDAPPPETGPATSAPPSSDAPPTSDTTQPGTT